MRCLVFNGWAAGPETWELCGFDHDWVFDYIEQLDGLPERVMEDFERVVLVGFSMGGTTALRLFAANPQKVAGLVLVSATPRMMECREEGWAGMSPRRLEAFRFGVETIFARDDSRIYAEENLSRGLKYLVTTDVRAALAGTDAALRASLPVEIIQSEKDGVVRPQNAAFLKTAFPRANVTMVPGTEHVLPVSAPELVDAAVESVMKEIEHED